MVLTHTAQHSTARKYESQLCSSCEGSGPFRGLRLARAVAVAELVFDSSPSPSLTGRGARKRTHCGMRAWGTKERYYSPSRYLGQINEQETEVRLTDGGIGFFVCLV